MKKYIIGMILLTLLIAGCSSGDIQISEDDKSFKIPLNGITDKVQKFDYDTSGTTVTYFVVKGTDGSIRTAFDACDVCGGSKGYMQQGDDIKCTNCGRVFSIDGLGTKNKGYGCWPSYLSHTLDNKNVIIKKAELTAGAHRFA